IDQAIGKEPSTGGVAEPKVYTYDDKLVVINRSGMLREFSYAGVEDTAAQYQFPIPSGQRIDHIRANDEGTVFVMTRGGSAYATLLYHKANSDVGIIPDTFAFPNIQQLYLTGDGSVVGVSPNNRRIDRFDLSNDTVSSSNLANTTSYMYGSTIGYVEDENGNAIVLWSYSDSTGVNKAISVDLIDAGTGTPTNLLFETSDGTGAYPNLYTFATFIDRSIAGGNLYMPICRGSSTDCFSSSTAPDMWVYKAELTGFGTPLKNDYDRNGYESDKLNYVALGDSFSSGEGNDPFLYGTDVPSVDECHRSKDAYPELLEKDSSLNLNLTAFASCSGAVTSNITGSGQWNEPRQINTVVDGTDLVTLTIGGNDIGFTEYATACVIGPCDEYSTIYDTTMASIDLLDTELEDVYSAILDKLPPSGGLYVMDYPMIVPMDVESTELPNPLCMEMYTGSIIGGTAENPLYNRWGNARGAQDVISSLNAKIDQAVSNIALTDSRIHFVDISSKFEGKDICSTSPSFFVNKLPPATFHPNSSAHEVFKTTVSEEIGE
ncbi:MAG: hypothetical protein JWO54_585, partial [Candidatus Saccharibacteria bacterium]|nr:hypothetical protein [Candidatus Saccharibacteria bacterium]